MLRLFVAPQRFQRVTAPQAGQLPSVTPCYRAVLGVAGVAMLIYVGFLVNDLGELTLHSDTWPYLLPLGLAAVLGWSQRWMRARPPRTAHADGDLPQSTPYVAAPTTDGSRLRGGQRRPRARLSSTRRRNRRPAAKAREAQGSA